MRKLLVFVFAFVSLYVNSQSVCGGKSTTITAPNPQGLAGPTYSLNPGGLPPVFGTADFVVSPPATTSYTLYTTGQNTNNVMVTTSVVVQVTVNPQPISVPQLTLGTCTSSLNAVNLGLSFNPASPVPGYTVNWNPLPPNVTSPQQTLVTMLTVGPHTVSISADGGCATTVTFEIVSPPAPALFTVTPFGSTHSITCTNPNVTLTAQPNISTPNLTYTWTGNSFSPVNSSSIILNATNVGTISLIGMNPTSSCTATYSFQLFQNTVTPTSSLSASQININCTQTTAPTFSAIGNPSINVTHYIYSPQNGTFSASSYTTIYYIGGPGTYTHVLVNTANGCTATKFFTVTSSDDYPIYDVTSPTNFTIGCANTGTTTIKIEHAATTPTPGGPISYTVIGPPTSTSIATGTLSGSNTYTVNVPGTWTVIVKDNTNNCQTRTQVSVLQNTILPAVSATVTQQVLDCNTPSIVLQGLGEAYNNANVTYNWSFVPPPGSPPNVQGSTITAAVNPAAVTNSVVNIFTLTVTDMNNACKNTSVIPIYQNTYPPQTLVSSQQTPAITCILKKVTLTNQSKTTIPNSTGFPNNLPVIGYLWTGPSPQEPLQVSSFYDAGTVGTYTLISKDLNNGCVSQNTFAVLENRIYPTFAPPSEVPILDCGEASQLIKSAEITAGPGTPTTVLTFSWSSPPGVTTGTNTQSTYSVGAPGVYTVLITNTVNACKTQSTVTVLSGVLNASFVASPDSGFAPLTVSFTDLSSSSDGTVNVKGVWVYGNSLTSTVTVGNGSVVPGAISNTQVASAVYSQPGTYKVTLFSIKGACMDTIYKYIKVDAPSALQIPNVFTPNGDGANDLFFLKATHLSTIDMKIVDRWGHVVYELKSSTGNIEWDGKNAQGKDSAEGTYFYVIKATGTDGQNYDQKGTISLYR